MKESYSNISLISEIELYLKSSFGVVYKFNSSLFDNINNLEKIENKNSVELNHLENLQQVFYTSKNLEIQLLNMITGLNHHLENTEH